jgi:1-deoxy-D-xylulose-5-phosphate reductoisomerase
MKNITLLGSTGSIGKNTLEVVSAHQDQFKIKALVAHSNLTLLEQQIKEFRPEVVALYDEKKAKELKAKESLLNVKVLSGLEGILEIASMRGCDLCVCAMSGAIGLEPALAAIHANVDLALANKEILVAAGELIMELARKKNVKVLPIDSEHSALFQILEGKKNEEVERLILTASGGPFFRKEIDLKKVSVEMALSHPTWKMGPKNTIDSSTMMNKGLEVIEAYWLFNISLDKIDVVVHPQSLIHSFVEFIDGSLLAQMSENTMLLPIQYALSYPKRIKRMVKPFDFQLFSRCDFFPPDRDKFPCLDLAYEALRLGGTAPCFMNAANEVLVKRCLDGNILWHEIAQKLTKLLSSYRQIMHPSLETLFAEDEKARAKALEI